MRNEDNNCIRYLMKEMDPSEELLMERAMMQDEDLLIEVESMRQTLQKLDRLPEVKPPSHVTDSILEKAAEHAQKKRDEQNSFKPAFKYAVAATLALTITAGGTWLFVGSDESPTQPSATASSASTVPVQQSDEASSMQVAGSAGSDIQSVSAGQTREVDPWIDRNDVLRFEDQFNGGNEQFQAIMKQATQKLQPLETPSVNGGRVNSIQLTGSSGN